jgi:hypothetical protein
MLYKKLVGKDEEAAEELSENLSNSDVSDSEDVDILANGDDISEEKGHGDDNQSSSRATNGGSNFFRRASFSSSGQEDMSTDSEVVIYLKISGRWFVSLPAMFNLNLYFL